MANRLYLNTQLLSDGLRMAAGHTDGPVLFMAGPGLLRLVAIHSADFVTSWERPADIDTNEGIVFIIPRHILMMLASDAFAGMDRLGATVGPSEVRIHISGGDAPAELNWHWNPRALVLPDDLARLIKVPPNPLQVDGKTLDEVVSSDDQAAIELALIPMTIAIGDMEISVGARRSTKLSRTRLVKALKIMGDGPLWIEVSDLGNAGGLMLQLLSRKGDWKVLCSLKEIAVTRKTGPLKAPELQEEPAEIKLSADPRYVTRPLNADVVTETEQSASEPEGGRQEALTDDEFPDLESGIEGVEPGAHNSKRESSPHVTAFHPEDVEEIGEADFVGSIPGAEAGDGSQNGGTPHKRKPLFDVPLD